MATFSQSTIDKGSDIFQDFLCSTCEDKELVKTADFYCKSCGKFYCGNCIHMHSQLFTKHAPFGRGDMKKWPVTKKVEDFLLKCDVHKEKNLEMFCDDHSDLCCTSCAFLNHRHCKKVTFISDTVKSRSTDLQKLSVSIQTILKEMKKLQDKQEASIQYVKSSYDEQLHTIQETRRKLNSVLDTIEQKTLKEMKDSLTKLQAASKGDVETCVRLQDELQQLRGAIQDISDKSKLEMSFIATRKCENKIEQCETFLKTNSIQVKVSITFQPNSEIVQYLSKLSGLGRIEHSTQTVMVQQDPNKVFIVQKKSIKNVRILTDSFKCNIVAICVLLDGQVMVLDNRNKKVKLLNEQYQVVSHCSVTSDPCDMCLVTPSEVAVAVNDENTQGIQFITVNNSQLVTGRKFQLQHVCRGITCHQGDLYINSYTTLFKYTMSGKQVSKIYEDPSDVCTVMRCAVSPTGDRLYITNFSNDMLLILASDEKLLATVTNPALEGPYGLHVTPAGQVLVCEHASNTVLQMDREGRRKLATLATPEDGVVSPLSMCYNRHTLSIIVGMFYKNRLLVLKVQ